MGHQAYIICPMVEESEQIEAEDVISYTEKLRSTLPQDITVSSPWQDETGQEERDHGSFCEK